MSKIIYCIFVLLLVLVNLNFLFADDVEFRHVVSRNDQMVGGELHLDLEIRIISGTSPRTLNSMTIDVNYSSEITEWPSDPSTNWAFDFLYGYSITTQRLTNVYRILITGDNVNAYGLPTPPGNPPGWDVTTDWQGICTLQWTINTATSVNITIDDATDAAAYFDNYTNAPQGGVTDFVVFNQDMGDISLPVELSTFSVVAGNDGVILAWVTESEVNNQGFEVYRSKDEKGIYGLLSSYASNNDLVGQGNSSSKHTYKFTDKTVMGDNTYWYKITDVDYNGARTYHGPISIFVAYEYIPDKFELSQNYPNPFNPETQIKVGIPDEKGISEIIINIYDIIGQKVKTLFKGNLEPGIHTIRWDGRDELGKQVSGGTYFYYLKSSQFNQIKKMIFMK